MQIVGQILAGCTSCEWPTGWRRILARERKESLAKRKSASERSTVLWWEESLYMTPSLASLEYSMDMVAVELRFGQDSNSGDGYTWRRNGYMVDSIQYYAMSTIQ